VKHVIFYDIVGFACTKVGLNATDFPCAPGFYCLTGAETAEPNITSEYGGLCPQGYYCPEGIVPYSVCCCSL